jgi:hypothetical protein
MRCQFYHISQYFSVSDYLFVYLLPHNNTIDRRRKKVINEEKKQNDNKKKIQKLKAAVVLEDECQHEIKRLKR